MSDSIKTRVARGVALLDEREPGWFKLVATGRLDMLSHRDDVLAQTWTGPVPSWSNPSSAHYDALFPDLVNEEASRYGLDGKSRRELNALTANWRRVVAARQGERS